MVLIAGNEINQTGPEFLLCKLKLIAFYLRFITTWFQKIHLFIANNEVVHRFDFAHRITTYPDKKLKLQNLEVIPRPFKQCFDLILKFELKKEKIFPPDCYLDWIVQIQDFQSVVFYSGRLLHQPSPILVDEHAGVVWFSRNHRNNITFFLSCDSKEITW